MRSTISRWAALTFAAFATIATIASADDAKPKTEVYKASTVNVGDIIPPRVVGPCKPGHCPFAGQSVTMLIVKEANEGAIGELRKEFEEATGAKLNLVQFTHQDLFPQLHVRSDHPCRQVRRRVRRRVGGWVNSWPATSSCLTTSISEIRVFPKWSIDDVLPAPRSLLSYAGKKYMVANDHDGQIMYYRRDLLEDAQHRAAFSAEVRLRRSMYRRPGAQFRDVAEYFNGRDLNGDSVPRSRVVDASQGRCPGHVPFHVVLGAVRDRPGQSKAVLVRSAGHENR